MLTADAAPARVSWWRSSCAAPLDLDQLR